MPKRHAEPDRGEVLRLLAHPKQIDAAPAEIIAAARNGGFTSGGGKRRGQLPPWTLEVTIKVAEVNGVPLERTTAKFKVREQPILALEHHLRPVCNDDGTEIPEGYHWDLHRPLSDSKTREIPDHQPTSPTEVVTMLMNRASILWQNSLEL